VAGPETANNAGTGGAFIPLLTLGLPSNAVMAILLGAMLIYGMQPGPCSSRAPRPLLGCGHQHVHRECDASGLEPSLIGLWVKILKIPIAFYSPHSPLCLVGAYSLTITPLKWRSW